jgi:hypothetical protein
MTAIASAWLGGGSLGGVLLVLIPAIALYALTIVPLAWNGPVGPYLRMTLQMLHRTGAPPPAGDGAVARFGGPPAALSTDTAPV